MSQEQFCIAQIGRTIGLWGDLKLNLHTDFPEQFKIGSKFKSDRGELTVIDVNFKRGTVRFSNYESLDYAKKLTNTKLYANLEETKENCTLKDGQFFWFDMIGCSVVEENEIVGRISDIQRMTDTDYLLIETDKRLIEAGFPKNFLLPYIERYITKVDIDVKKVYVKDAKEILEAS